MTVLRRDEVQKRKPPKFKNAKVRKAIQQHNRENRKIDDPVKRKAAHAKNRKRVAKRKAEGKSTVSREQSITRKLKSMGLNRQGNPTGGTKPKPKPKPKPRQRPTKKTGGRVSLPGDKRTTGRTSTGTKRFPDRGEYKRGEVRRYEPSTGKLSSNKSKPTKKKPPTRTTTKPPTRTSGTPKPGGRTRSSYSPRGR